MGRDDNCSVSQNLALYCLYGARFSLAMLRILAICPSTCHSSPHTKNHTLVPHLPNIEKVYHMSSDYKSKEEIMLRTQYGGNLTRRYSKASFLQFLPIRHTLVSKFLFWTVVGREEATVRMPNQNLLSCQRRAMVLTCTREKGSMTRIRFCSSKLSYNLAKCVLMIGSSRSSAR